MKLFNSLTRKIEDFKPYNDNKVMMYTCGPTVYHYAHIGNLRTYIFEDILEKGLSYLGYDVIRAMNITDVGHLTSDGDTGEDKMEKGAKREGKSVYEIADFYTNAFLNDMSSLNVKIPKIIEKASANIDIYIEMIQKLLDDGYAYLSNGNVYFDISKAKNYYQLSGKNPADLKVGVRDSVDLDVSKKNPADFVLWFTLSKFENQVMKWDSPWGVGYPGWHIECSGISNKIFGDHLDIHCGGVDNIFPHHTNEIAQSEAFLGHKWCNYWCHGAHLNDEFGKVSKSNGEFLTLTLLKEKGYSPIDYRFFCLNSHYRNSLVFSFDSLDIAKNTLKKLKNKILSLSTEKLELDKYYIQFYSNKFKAAFENDINTSLMLTVLYDLLKDSNVNDYTKRYIIQDFDKVLSLDLFSCDEDEDVDDSLKKYILEKIELRNVARNNKDFQLADQIRDELLNRGIKLIDSREGTTYKKV